MNNDEDDCEFPTHEELEALAKQGVLLEINLDGLMGDEFPICSGDIGGLGHIVIIHQDDKQKCIDEMTEWFRKKVEEYIQPYEWE